MGTLEHPCVHGVNCSHMRLFMGADIDRDVLFKEDRIDTFYCDQLDRVAIHDL
jgi:hypothetical protein